jgi:hypothetical protein
MIEQVAIAHLRMMRLLRHAPAHAIARIVPAVAH